MFSYLKFLDSLYGYVIINPYKIWFNKSIEWSELLRMSIKFNTSREFNNYKL